MIFLRKIHPFPSLINVLKKLKDLLLILFNDLVVWEISDFADEKCMSKKNAFIFLVIICSIDKRHRCEVYLNN